MHPFETVFVAMLERGQLPAASDFGGWNSLLEAVGEIGAGLLMPEFLKLATAALEDAPEELSTLISDFICRCLDAARDDFVLVEIVDLLEEARPLPDNVDDRCFTRFLAASMDHSLGAMGRAAALDGAFRWALDQRQRQLRLLAALLDFGTNDHPLFLPRLAKIMGVAYSYWREDALVGKLRTLTEVEGANVEAAFELGVAKLTNGFEAHDSRAAAEAFAAARHWFGIALCGREQRPDALAYACGLDMLDGFSRLEEPQQLEEYATSICSAAFQLDAWIANETDPSWLGARHVEQVCWNMLAFKLRTTAGYLTQASWWEPSQVVEQHLVAVYVASRSVLRRSKSGGVEAIVRPRLERTLADHEGQAFALKLWLKHNTGREWEDAARELNERVDELVAEGIQSPSSQSPSILSSVGTLIARADIPKNAKILACAAIEASQSLLLKDLSAAEISIYEACISKVITSPDFSRNEAGNKLFCAIVFWTVRFLKNRLDMTKGDMPNVGYLFEQEDGRLPNEAALQVDYYQFMSSVVGAGAEIEVSNIGGGRADLRFKSGAERLVVEVKREKGDCSFSGLASSYAAQASDYQNVSIRLGLLLVLDQTARRTEGTPHISSLIETRPDSSVI
jgi:hypothetical protein